MPPIDFAWANSGNTPTVFHDVGTEDDGYLYRLDAMHIQVQVLATSTTAQGVEVRVPMTSAGSPEYMREINRATTGHTSMTVSGTIASRLQFAHFARSATATNGQGKCRLIISRLRVVA